MQNDSGVAPEPRLWRGPLATRLGALAFSQLRRRFVMSAPSEIIVTHEMIQAGLNVLADSGAFEHVSPSDWLVIRDLLRFALEAGGYVVKIGQVRSHELQIPS